MQPKYLIFAIVFGSATISLLIFLILFLSSISYFNDTEESFEQREASTYKYMRYDSDNDFTTRGFLSIFEELEDEDAFLSYKEETTGNHVLISNFEAEEYVCTGTCACEKVENDERRSSPSITTSSSARVLTYLVAAATTFTAFSFAKKHFEEECVRYFSETDDDKCPSPAYRVSAPKVWCGLEAKKNDITEIEYEYFWCSGNCMESKFFRNRQDRDELIQLHGEDKCSKMRQEGEVAVYKHETNVKKGMKSCARYKFIKEYLTNWCRWESIHTHLYEWKSPSSGEPKEKELCAHLCVGQLDGCHGQDNPSVVCLEYPEGGKLPKTRRD